MHKQKEKNFVRSSSNVFRDMRSPNPEEALTKAKLMHRIITVLKEQGLNWKNRRDKKKLAEFLHISSPDEAATTWNNLVSGQVRKFTIGQLLDYLSAVDGETEIIVCDAGGPVQFQVKTG